MTQRMLETFFIPMRSALSLLLLALTSLPLLAESLEERVTRLEKELSDLRSKVEDLRRSSSAQPSAPKPVHPVANRGRLALAVSNKIFQDIDVRRGAMGAGVYWDSEYTSHFDRPIRAVKGKLVITDLFDEVKLTIGWTIDSPMQPGQTISEMGKGISYNQFMATHQWLKTTKLEDMKMRFEAEQVILEDGTKVEMKE